MNTSLHYLQFKEQAGAALPMGDPHPLLRQPSEIDRLLTAAVVNRRFRQLLLANPLAAVAHGYRGAAFRLNSEEMQRLSMIRATSLHDFALQCLLPGPEQTATSYESCLHPALIEV